MGIFYAYVTGPSGEPFSRHIFAFLSQDSSDRWWRALQAQRNANKTMPDQWNMLRVSAQCYVIEGSAAWTFHEQNLLSPAKGFIVHNMYFGTPEAPRIVPPPARADYLNGKVYSIRLSGHSDILWNIELPTTPLPGKPNLRVSATRVGSMKFLIQRTNPLPDEDILIDSDEVTMTAVVSGKKRDTVALDGAYLQPNSNKPVFKFKFEAFFTGGFGVVEGGDKIVWSGGLGDKWELVD